MPEILPPTGQAVVKVGPWRVTPRQAAFIKIGAATPILAVAGWLLQNFLQLRGVVNLLASRVDLGFLAVCLFLVVWVLTIGLPRKEMWRLIFGVIIVLVAIGIDRLAPLPTTPPQATSPFITIGITPAVFPISVSPHSTLSILPLHPYQTFTDSAGHLHIFDNPCGEEHVWPTQDEINSKPKNGYEEVRTVEVTNHSQFTIESGRAIFTLTYNESFGGGCMPPPKSATRQEDVVSLPSLDQGKAFRFVAINQTKSCVWLLPPATIKVKMTGDEAEREIPIKREETNIANWTDTPFPPTSVQWQGVPARNPGYGIVRSTASCGLPKINNGLKIMYGRADLEGQTIPVTTRYATVDGKPMVGAGENFSLSEFRVENLNSQITGDVSAEIYLSKQAQSGAWQGTASDESEFPSAFYMPASNYGNVPSKINPQQTISLTPFWVSITGPWSPTDIVAARLKIFYGAERPAVANFRIRKKAMSQ